MNNKPDIQISCFKSSIGNFEELINKISEISKNCTLQLIDADGIAGYEHVLHATIHAVKAFERGENIAKDLGLEICVRASAQRQISKALSILGIKEGKMNICAVSVNCNKNIMGELGIILDKQDDSILKVDETLLKEIYNISDREIKAAGSISNVMMERTTLLILET
ncbi:MAG: KEOPS complex subunit Cgi121 [Methanobacteriaceae archaeon]|jgi:KEOPS complex subunit Cgi121